MKRKAVNQLKEGDILAKEVATSGGLVLIPQGTSMKKQYTDRLKDLGIQYVYIEEVSSKESPVEKPTENEEEKIKSQCQTTVKETMDKFSYLGNTELSRIKDVAEEIILDILEEPEIMYSVSGIRNKGDQVYAHCLNVCALSVLMALKMKLPNKKVREIAVGSLLHDIGYIYVPGDLLYREIEEMDTEQRSELKKHVVYGFEAMKEESWLSATARNIILYHHERLDGSGYPFRWKEERIKTEVRIVTICDAFDRWVYGFFCEPMKVHKALERITSESEKAFDFEIVKIFLESVAAFPNGTHVIINDGREAKVLRQNPKCPTRPVLQILPDGEELDLTKELNIVISDTI